ncbi:MAG: prefoldin subunit alpha [Thermoplasmata archaeon]|nr:prefoldin subunit alpha [Thermoplasmata archaeon]
MANEEFQKAATEYEMFRSQLEALAQQNELLTMSLEEHMRAKETMTRFQEGGKGSEILVPVGANSFLFAEIKVPDKAIIGIGSDLTVEEDMGDAIKRLDGKIEDLNSALKSLAEKIAEVSQNAEEKSEIVRTLYAQAQQGTE